MKAERLRKNLTLKDISRTTRISVFILETLEGDHEDFSPPLTYARGFLRAYALELELDPDEILSIFEQDLKERQKTAPVKKMQEDSSRSIPGYLVPVALGAMLLLGWALYFGYMGRSSDTPLPVDGAGQEQNKEPEPQSTSVTTTAPEPPSTQPAEPAAPVAPAAPPVDSTTTTAASAAAQPFTVRFFAGERSWLRFSVDDKHDFDVLLKPGESYSVNAVTGLKVKIGNPGGLKAFFNDRSVTVPGRRGVPVEMSFPETPDASPAR